MKVVVVFSFSELASSRSFEKKVSDFLTRLARDFDIVGNFLLSTVKDFEIIQKTLDINKVDAIVLYPLTGGTEMILKEFAVYRRPTVVYGDPYNNSLAAGIEIREYFRERLIPSTLVKDENELKKALLDYGNIKEELNKFLRARFGLIGRISPWLINERFELPYTHISLKKFYEYYERVSDDEGWNVVDSIVKNAKAIKEPQKEDLIKAGRIYVAIKSILEDYRLDGFTIGCFDIVMKSKMTPCLALAMFNTQGVPASCEGELSSLLGMYVIRAYFNEPTFMGNVVDFGKNYLTLAHCTAPLIESYVLRNHFESKSGVGIDVNLPKGDASLFKLRGKMAVIKAVKVSDNEHFNGRCRTQVRLETKNAKEFINLTIGNHHLLAYVEPEELGDLLSKLGFDVRMY